MEQDYLLYRGHRKKFDAEEVKMTVNLEPEKAHTDLFNSDPSDVELVDGNSSDEDEDDEDEDDGVFERMGCGYCASAGNLWYVKITLNVILPICWVALGGYYAEDYFALYYADADDGEWDGFNSADKQIVYFCVTAIIIVGVSLLMSLILHLMKFVSFRMYLEIASSASILIYGLVAYYSNVNNTSNEFFYSYMNGWAIATITLAGFMLLYHTINYLDYIFPCCCRGDVCCDWDKDFVQETESELDRMEKAGVDLDAVVDNRDKYQEQQVNEQYAAKVAKREEKKARRKAREAKRKERRKRKAMRMRQEKQEWLALQKRFSYFCW